MFRWYEAVKPEKEQSKKWRDLCSQCKSRVQLAWMKFTGQAVNMSFANCTRRKRGKESCYNAYCDFIREFMHKPKKIRGL